MSLYTRMSALPEYVFGPNWRTTLTGAGSKIGYFLTIMAAVPYEKQDPTSFGALVYNSLPENFRPRFIIWCGIASTVLGIMNAFMQKDKNVAGNNTINHPTNVADGTLSGKTIPLILLACMLCGCASLKTASRNTGAWFKSHQPQINATLASIASTAAQDAEKIVLSAAISYADGTTKGNMLDGLSYGLRTNETSLLTAADVQRIVEIWTPAQTGPQHWEELAKQLADTYAKAHPHTPAASAAVIEAIAQGLNTASAANKGV